MVIPIDELYGQEPKQGSRSMAGQSSAPLPSPGSAAAAGGTPATAAAATSAAGAAPAATTTPLAFNPWGPHMPSIMGPHRATSPAELSQATMQAHASSSAAGPPVPSRSTVAAWLHDGLLGDRAGGWESLPPSQEAAINALMSGRRSRQPRMLTLAPLAAAAGWTAGDRVSGPGMLAHATMVARSSRSGPSGLSVFDGATVFSKLGAAGATTTANSRPSSHAIPSDVHFPE